MTLRLILASRSEIRARLLKNAGLTFKIEAAQIDEISIRERMLNKNAHPKDIAKALAEEKAKAISIIYPERLVLGCDQIATLGQEILTKPENPEMAKAQLRTLSGETHFLYSAAALYLHGLLVWQHVGEVSLRMHEVSETYREEYVARNWHSIRHSVGAYKLEEEGVRLFSAIEGDYFHVLGLPLIELLSYLIKRGELQG